MKKFITSLVSVLSAVPMLVSCGNTDEKITIKYAVPTDVTSDTVSVTTAETTAVPSENYENSEESVQYTEPVTSENNTDENIDLNPFDDMDFDTELPSSYYIYAEPIYQNPELPTGCEITSLAMLLNYLGYSADKVDLSQNYLNKNYDYSCTFYDAFIGNPESDSGFGCYAPVIADAAYSYLRVIGSSMSVHNITGLSLEEVFHYIAMDRPVVIWASMSLVDVRYYLAWTTDSGVEAWWYENEHCMLLTGYDYDNGTVTVCDPLKGEYTYDMYRFEEIFNELEQQAVTIY